MNIYRGDGVKKIMVMWEKEEQDKYKALWAGVIFFTLLIGFLWFLNIKNQLENAKLNKKELLDFGQVTQEFDSGLVEVKSKVIKMKSVLDREELPFKSLEENNIE